MRMRLTLLLAAAPALALSGPASSQPAPAPAAPAAPLFETRKVEGADNVYIFRYGGAQSISIVTPAGVVATDPRPPRGRASAGSRSNPL